MKANNNKSMILCVDDDKMVLDTLERQLSKALSNEYVVEIAEGPEEAWEVIDQFRDEHPLAVVISDWLMPKIKGDEFLMQLHRKFPEINKIMLSGEADPVAVENVRIHAKLNAFVAKPWDIDHLLSLVKGKGNEKAVAMPA